MKPLPAYLAVGATVLTLMGCALTGKRLIDPPSRGELITPGQSTIQQDMKSRPVNLGSVVLALGANGNHFTLPAEAYTKLLRYDLKQAFDRADVAEGSPPALTANFAIERMAFVKGTYIFPDPSILKVRIDIVRPDGKVLLRGAVECRDLATIPIPWGLMAVPHSGSESMAHAKLIPAVATLLSSVVVGLREGKTLDELVILPDENRQVDYVLLHGKFGLAPLTKAETEAVTGLRLPADGD